MIQLHVWENACAPDTLYILDIRFILVIITSCVSIMILRNWEETLVLSTKCIVFLCCIESSDICNN